MPNRVLRVPAALLFALLAPVFGQTTTATTTTITYTTSSGMPPVGLAPTETAQINLVNTSAVTASSIGTQPACTGSVSFFNAAGAQVGTSTGFLVGPGKIASVTLPYSTTGAGASRTMIRVVITNIVTLTNPFPPGGAASGSTTGTIFPAAGCSLSASLEVYDTATGVLHALIPVSVPVSNAAFVRTGDFNAASEN
jgi:hypothetical protein